MDVDLQEHWLIIDFYTLKIKLTLTVLLCETPEGSSKS